MNHKEYIEDLFRKRFESEEAPVSESVWSNIKSSLPPEKKDRPGYGIYLISLVAILIVGVSSYGIYKNVISIENKNQILLSENTNGDKYITHKNEKEQLNPGPIKNKLDQPHNLNGNKTNEEVGDEKNNNKVVISTNQINNKENLFTSFPNEIIKQSLHHPSSNKKDLGDFELLVQSKQENQKSRPIKNNLDHELEANTNVKVSNQEQSIKTPPSLPLNDSRIEMTDRVFPREQEKIVDSKNNNQVDQNSKSKDFEVSGKNQRQVDHKENFNQSEESSYSNVINDESKIALEINLSDESKEKRILASDDKEKNDSIIKTEEEDQSRTTNNSRKRTKRDFSISVPLSVDLFLGPNLSYRTISGSADYKSDINSFEKIRPNLFGGARLNVELSERVKLGLGVSYNSYGENYTISKNKMAEKYQVNYKLYQDSLGLAHFDPVDTVKFHQAGKTKNHYNYLSIPLSATYLFKTGNLSLGVTAGAAANMLLSASTSRVEFYSDSLTRVVSERSTDPNSRFRKFAISIFACPIITYDVNDKWKLFVEPGFTYFINSVYKADYPIKRNLYAVEVKAGLRFRFN